MALYKYVAPNRIDILKDGLISFTPPSGLNDAFEMSPYFGEFLSHSEVRNEVEKAFKLSAPHILPDGTLYSFDNAIKFLGAHDISGEDFLDLITTCMSQKVKEQITPDYKKYFYDRIDSEYGVLCITERPDNLLMWSHYSLGHHGFVIEFDEQHPFFNQKLQIPGVGCLGKVKYSKLRPDLPSFTDITPTDMFFSKSEDWQYEQEWRIVRPLKEAKEIIDISEEKRIYRFEIPTECIKGIILGCKMSPEEIMYLKANDARYTSIKLSRAQINDRTYNLDIIDL